MESPPAAAAASATRVLTVNAKIRAAPKFHPDHYRRWREEIWFWKEAHYFSPDDTLIAELALGSEGSLRTLMIKFLKETRPKPSERAFRNLFVLLDSVFKKQASEQAIHRMEAF